ncbi:hypothetical protein HOV30_gp001 [Erwinia phage Derbicus]|uniref:Uncharacterized protein n=1 Tax=Erwinia phage Derbicus TaxID=2530027 RepID=A0A482IFA7_9CAUD|nr:hypothetical protein HOV30_gp001 [Erwinia phage Derbicus]QBP07428.1 hypothetical protein DERBICUS_1 [Erwinia phage Derbicus]
MENEISIHGNYVRASATESITHGELSTVIKEAIAQFQTDYPDLTINSAIVTTSEFMFELFETKRVIANIWLTTDRLVIKDVGDLLYGGVIPLPLTGQEVKIAAGSAITRGYLWKRDSYVSSYDLQLDFLSRQLIEEHIGNIINTALAIK